MPPGTVWTPDEDEELRRLVEELGEKKWAQISGIMKIKTSKQCRRRWLNHLNMENSKKGGWSTEEDEQLLDLHGKYGNKWTEIARRIGGRTDNAVKNRYHAIVRKDEKTKCGSGEMMEGSEGSALTSQELNDMSSRDLLKNCSLERVRQELSERAQHVEDQRQRALSGHEEEMKIRKGPPNLTVIIPQDQMSCPLPVGQIFVPQDMLSPVEKKWAEEVNDMDDVPVHISFIGDDKGEVPEIMDYTALPQGSFLSNGDGSSIPLCVFPSAESLLETLKTSCTPRGSIKFEPIDPTAHENGRSQAPPPAPPMPLEGWQGQPCLTEEHKKLLTRLFMEGKKGSLDLGNNEMQMDPVPVSCAAEPEPVRLEQPNGHDMAVDGNPTTSGLTHIMPESPFVSQVEAPPLPSPSDIPPLGPISPSGVQLSPIFSQVNLESLLSVMGSFTSSDLVDFINTSGIRMVDASQVNLPSHDPMDEG
ncbi:unnamed protein product [Ostreobium quekettii]|uniref:Uncharacterized protein n=1 Tax=Ostreobium quekettii TaxID=121088 RepID=A0A8S1JCT5_9CHLO|nr:unnamed protein product [Ostreobium quekettii]|eukprot:evm.model.scf_2408.1 EVM.evm.TU.scf_2408.1   scf_2408:7559-11429(+)